MLIKIRRGEMEFGPYSLVEAKEYYVAGRIIDTDWAQYEGSTKWVSVREIPGLLDANPAWQAVEEPATDSWWCVARDVAIVQGLLFCVGIVAGLTMQTIRTPRIPFNFPLVCSSLAMQMVGFTISGSIAKGPRWHHLAKVAIGVWLTNLIGVLLKSISLPGWILNFFVMLVLMVAGGGLSYLFKRNNQ